MKGQIRNIFPGGNTPLGFYSYYNHILPQRKAEKIFSIKGGPGTGKSTLMRAVGEYFAGKGEAVDYMWCSSDPASLDGVLLKKRAIALVDGTAPHIVDPVNPGAVDEIVNLGEFWDEAGIRKNRKTVIFLNEQIGRMFRFAYGYLKSASAQYELMEELLRDILSQEEIYECRRQIEMKAESISIVKRAENRRNREMALGKDWMAGEKKKFFAGAITPAGLINNISSIAAGIEHVIVLSLPAGFPVEELLAPLSDKLVHAGIDVEEYYCPMCPERRIEHLVAPQAGCAFITSNVHHLFHGKSQGQKVTEIALSTEAAEKKTGGLLRSVENDSKQNISKALDFLKQAKAYHDELEQCYVPYMDFDGMERRKEKLIAEIEEYQ